jgi:peptide/nickel transport system permease protein
MVKYITARLLYSGLIVIGAVTIVFGLLYLTGDPVSQLLPIEASPQDRDALRRELGFDQPLHIQYAKFLSRVAQGDFGSSLRYRRPAMDLVLERMPATIQLTLVALVISLVIAIPSGIISAIRRGTVLDNISVAFALLGQCVPTFWLGLVLIVIFAVTFPVLPPSGSGSWEYLVLPGFTLGVNSAAIVARLLRSSLLEVLSQDYVRTARAKGLNERGVIFRHALKNASIPVVTIVGLQVGVLLGGAIVTEYVFSYPGLGRLILEGISKRDFPIVQASVVLIASIVASINLLVDLLYVFLDPRIRYE